MNYTRLVLLDFKIEELVSKKKFIDYRLAELYEEREEVVSELYEEQTPICCNGCKE